VLSRSHVPAGNSLPHTPASVDQLSTRVSLCYNRRCYSCNRRFTCIDFTFLVVSWCNVTSGYRRGKSFEAGSWFAAMSLASDATRPLLAHTAIPETKQ
jgi:hypothetical protein